MVAENRAWDFLVRRFRQFLFLREGETMQQEVLNEKKNKFREDIFDWFSAIIFAVICVIIVFTFCIRTVSVSGTSMVPTLQNKDTLLMSRIYSKIENGDIVVLTKPIGGDEPLIKRVIATEGQVVDIDFEKGYVFVDGVILDEPYIFEPTTTSWDVNFPQVVPENCVFVLGDNRNNSKDSRWASVGMIDERYIAGKVIYRITPNAGKL